MDLDERLMLLAEGAPEQLSGARIHLQLTRTISNCIDKSNNSLSAFPWRARAILEGDIQIGFRSTADRLQRQVAGQTGRLNLIQNDSESVDERESSIFADADDLDAFLARVLRTLEICIEVLDRAPQAYSFAPSLPSESKNDVHDDISKRIDLSTDGIVACVRVGESAASAAQEERAQDAFGLDQEAFVNLGSSEAFGLCEVFEQIQRTGENGKWLAVEFWGSQCGPCQPAMEALLATLGLSEVPPRGSSGRAASNDKDDKQTGDESPLLRSLDIGLRDQIVGIALSFDKDQRMALHHAGRVARWPLQSPEILHVGWVGRGASRAPFPALLGISATPTLVLIDPLGIVRYKGNPEIEGTLNVIERFMTSAEKSEPLTVAASELVALTANSDIHSRVGSRTRIERLFAGQQARANDESQAELQSDEDAFAISCALGALENGVIDGELSVKYTLSTDLGRPTNASAVASTAARCDERFEAVLYGIPRSKSDESLAAIDALRAIPKLHLRLSAAQA